MAKKPQKAEVKELIKNLVNSEIPGIQAAAKEMGDWIKQLEDHANKLQEYANKIESLTENEAMAAQNKENLDEFIKQLEKTLAKLRKKPELTEADKAEISKAKKLLPETKTKEVAGVKIQEEQAQKAVISEAEARLLKKPLYTTPEGFVVRKTRH